MPAQGNLYFHLFQSTLYPNLLWETEEPVVAGVRRERGVSDAVATAQGGSAQAPPAKKTKGLSTNIQPNIEQSNKAFYVVKV